ncbi:MAG TPA: O-antigen ligase family protein, partial [Candidatus Paceibacterota bacterium]|nr:O-antigen ligase family protein [Candidatus Paceibacterota bacterium]
MALTTTARWTILGVLFVIPFLPLFVANGMFFPFISSKGFAFRILIEIAAGAWLLLMLADKRYRPQFSWPLAIYGAFVLWMFIADLFAANPHKAFWSNYERMDGWVTMIHVFLFFLVAGSFLSVEKLWKRWWLTLLGASALVSVYGLWQIFGLAQIHQGGVRADASFGNAIYLAVYLMFTVLIAAWQAIESKGWLRWALTALIALQVVIIFATATRGAILGLFAAISVIAVAWAATSGGAGKKAAIGVIGLLLVIAGGLFLIRDSAFVRSEPTLARIVTVFEASELKVRATLWGMAYEGFLERPITGWGQEGYNYVFNKYYKPSLFAQESWFDRAHNTYLDWLVAGGAPALLLFLALLVSAFLSIYRSAASKPEKLILLGILVGYALQAVSSFDNLFSYILLAAILAMAHEKSARPIKQFERAPEMGTSALGTLGAPVILVGTIAVLWTVNVPGIEGSGHLIKAAQQAANPSAALAEYQKAVDSGSFASQEIAEQVLSFGSGVASQATIPMETRQAAVTLALTTMQKEVAKAPNDARIRLMYAGGLRAAGDAAGYEKEMQAALALSPKKQAIIFQKGIASWQAGDKVSAARDFDAGYALDTSFPNAA